jgi:hypothetical protein
VFDLRGDGDGAGTMTFEELWGTLPIPAGYWKMTIPEQVQWAAMAEAAFTAGLLYGSERNSGCAQTADSKRISNLEAAVAEIRAAMEIESQADITWIDSRTKSMESALKVIHTWASFPESFDFEQTKRLCMSALGREE